MTTQLTIHTRATCEKYSNTLERRRYKTNSLKFALWCLFAFSHWLIFSGGIEMEHCLKMGQNKCNTLLCCLHCWTWTCHCQLVTHINEKSEFLYYHLPNFSNNGDRKKRKIKPTSSFHRLRWSAGVNVVQCFFIRVVFFCVSLSLS